MYGRRSGALYVREKGSAIDLEANHEGGGHELGYRSARSTCLRLSASASGRSWCGESAASDGVRLRARALASMWAALSTVDGIH